MQYSINEWLYCGRQSLKSGILQPDIDIGHLGENGLLIHMYIGIIINCAEFQLIWMNIDVQLPSTTAVEFYRFGTNGLIVTVQS